MRKIIVKINRKKAEYLERLNYELNFAKDIVQRLIEAHPNDADIVNGETFKHYQRHGAELQAEYNIAAAETEKEYIPEGVREHKYSWLIPANSDEMIVTIQCSCHIEGVEDEKI